MGVCRRDYFSLYRDGGNRILKQFYRKIFNDKKKKENTEKKRNLLEFSRLFINGS